MIRLIETLFTATLGAAIAYATGMALQDVTGATGVAVTAGVIGGLNGLFAGARGIYAWRTPGGVLAFVLDSSWALVSTFLGVLLNVYNTLHPGSEFAPEYSVRRNRHVFGRGFRLKRSFATTQGNVVTNARLGRDAPISERHDLIERHEGLHVWQQRWFGPIFPLTYVVVGVLGGVVGFVFGIASRERRRRGVKIGKLIETAAYYDNPFEIWAYRRDDRWDSNSAQPVLKWGTFKWPDEADR